MIKRISVAVIILLDILLLPSVLRFPEYLIKYHASAATFWLRDFDVIEAGKLLLTDLNIRQMWLYAQLLLGIFVLMLFWKDMPGNKNRIKEGVGGPEAVGSGEYGSSRWMTEKEMDKKTTIWKFGESVQKGGIVVGVKMKKGYAWIIDDDSHTLIIGATRSGKSRRLALPTIWQLGHAGESMILTDPKGELYEMSHRWLIRQGYKIVCLDFREPGRGNRWNPLHPVVDAVLRENVSEAVQLSNSIAHMFVHRSSDSKKGDQVWNDGAQSVISALSLAVAIDAPEDDQKHMYSVYKMLGEMGEVQKIGLDTLIDYVPLNEYMKNLPIDHPARDAFVAARLAPERMRGSFYAQVATLLQLFADPSVAYLTGAQDHDLAGPGKEKTAVYLIIPDEDSTRHPLAALYVDQAYQSLVKLANLNKGRLPIRVNMILDEFGNMPQFKDFATKLTVSGGRGIRWHLIVQDFQQLEEKYGSAAETIKGNCHVWIYLLTSSTKTAEEISQKMGEYTIQTGGSSVTDAGKMVSRSQSSGITGRRLLKPDELMRFPENEAIILRLRHFPARVPLPDFSQWPASRVFIPERGDENRVISKVPVFIPSVGETKTSDSSNDISNDQNFVFLDED